MTEPGTLYMYAVVLLTITVPLLFRTKERPGKTNVILALYLIAFSFEALAHVRCFPYLTVI